MTQLVPGTIMLHHKGKTIGYVGDDGNLHTHNMSLLPKNVRRWDVIAESAVPTKLAGYLGAARRRAASNPEIWTG